MVASRVRALGDDVDELLLVQRAVMRAATIRNEELMSRVDAWQRDHLLECRSGSARPDIAGGGHDCGEGLDVAAPERVEFRQPVF